MARAERRCIALQAEYIPLQAEHLPYRTISSETLGGRPTLVPWNRGLVDCVMLQKAAPGSSRKEVR